MLGQILYEQLSTTQTALPDIEQFSAIATIISSSYCSNKLEILFSNQINDKPILSTSILTAI